ncbi:MAG: hypothetical protein WCO54_10075, partial [Bacteroidota bacterium]
MKTNHTSKLNKQILIYLLGMFALLSSALLNKASASHMVGSDISYQCTGTPGVWHIKLAIYRDCQGIPLGTCTGGCGSSCSPYGAMTITGADPSCNGTSFGTFMPYLTSVTDVNPNPNCPSAKSICTNMGCVTPGTYTPGVEKYVFEGDIDLRNSAGIPASCCMIRIAWTECCRNSAITTGAAGNNFYIEAVINRCASMNPCNSSPDLSNDPFAVLCGGQAFVFNNGAVDPDHDSLTYAFAPGLQAAGQSVTYNAPFAWDAPMPYTGAKNGPFPTGINCDPITGDIMFTPANGSGSSIVGVMAVEIKQWGYDANGNPVLLGITRRDIQMWLITCPPNNPPRIMTNPSNGNQPKTYWEICAGNTLCFDVIAKDTDYYPFNSPP